MSARRSVLIAFVLVLAFASTAAAQMTNPFVTDVNSVPPLLFMPGR